MLLGLYTRVWCVPEDSRKGRQPTCFFSNPSLSGEGQPAALAILTPPLVLLGRPLLIETGVVCK